MVKRRGANDPSPWMNSRAKMLLRQDILDGKVVDSMKPKQVFEMRPEYEPYGLVKFRTNLKNLRDGIKKNHAKADSNSATLAHERRMHPPLTQTSRGYPRWDGSDAERFIKEDTDAGLTNSMKPSDLRGTRLEYQAFPLQVFRNHIHKDKRAGCESGYWMKERQKKKTK
jgi:hypothetical protein